LILDRGEEDGIKKGQAVVLFDNLVGEIDHVVKDASRVILATSSEVSFTGRLENGAIGVVKGMGNTIEIDNILLSEDIRKDSLVYTRGDEDLSGAGIPPDLVVGKIVSIEKNPSALFQKAQIKSEINFSKLAMVFVVVK
jgi:rod shape-determining protein MreC